MPRRHSVGVDLNAAPAMNAAHASSPKRSRSHSHSRSHSRSHSHSHSHSSRCNRNVVRRLRRAQFPHLPRLRLPHRPQRPPLPLRHLRRPGVSRCPIVLARETANATATVERALQAPTHRERVATSQYALSRVKVEGPNRARGRYFSSGSSTGHTLASICG